MGSVDFWKEYIESYDKVLSSLSSYYKLVNIHKNALKDKKRILESCAGSGILALELLKQGKEVHALDQNKYGLEILKKRAKTFNLTAYVCDANEIPFKDNYFDGVSSMLAIPFMKDPIKYLKENTRVLKNRGIFIISGPSESAKDFAFVENEWIKELKQKGLFEKLKKEWGISYLIKHKKT